MEKTRYEIYDTKANGRLRPVYTTQRSADQVCRMLNLPLIGNPAEERKGRYIVKTFVGF